MMNAHKILENVSYVIASCGIGLGGFAVYQCVYVLVLLHLLLSYIIARTQLFT